MIAPRRKPFYTEPGQRLILTTGLMDFAERVDEFADASGLDVSDFVSHPVVTVPLPRAIRDDHENLLRWTGLNPVFLACPLFWLPKHVALRYRIRYPDGSVQIETDAEWSLRVALEMNASGLYDEDTGTWVDVLSVYGLDVDDVKTQHRIRQWLAGGKDVVLDSINISQFFEPQDNNPEWALSIVDATRDAVLQAQFAASAQSLMLTVDDTMSQHHDAAFLHAFAAFVASLGLLGFQDLPASQEYGDPLVSLREMFTAMSEQSTQIDPIEVFVRVRKICMDVNETYGFALDDFFAAPDDTNELTHV